MAWYSPFLRGLRLVFGRSTGDQSLGHQFEVTTTNTNTTDILGHQFAVTQDVISELGHQFNKVVIPEIEDSSPLGHRFRIPGSRTNLPALLVFKKENLNSQAIAVKFIAVDDSSLQCEVIKIPAVTTVTTINEYQYIPINSNELTITVSGVNPLFATYRYSAINSVGRIIVLDEED